MKVSSIAMICLSSLAVSACSFTPREQAEGGFDYTNTQSVQALEPAPGKQLPERSRRYEIPPVDGTGAVGANMNVLPPVLVRGTAAGSRASENVDVTAVDFSELDGMEDLPNFTWEGIKAASEKMTNYINDLNMSELEKPIISNVTANETSSSKEIKSLLISQIEKKVRWLESVEYMINNGVKNFVEIGPGKVLSGLIKRINKNVNVNSINNEEDIKLLIND